MQSSVVYLCCVARFIPEPELLESHEARERNWVVRLLFSQSGRGGRRPNTPSRLATTSTTTKAPTPQISDEATEAAVGSSQS